MDFARENELRTQGFRYICGVDEAGRGPLVGPVYAASVILPDDFDYRDINDSKKLSEKKRESLFDYITLNAVSYGIGFAEVREIDAFNILNATFLAMRRAIDNMSVKPDYILIDGNKKPGSPFPEEAIIKGDGQCVSIAAASILAKVSRDRVMGELALRYPDYGFEKHKGYATAAHVAAIKKFGAIDEHRSLFLRKILNDKDNMKMNG